jgi:hypothetical protein
MLIPGIKEISGHTDCNYDFDSGTMRFFGGPSAEFKISGESIVLHAVHGNLWTHIKTLIS